MEPKQPNFVRLFIIILSVKLLHRRESFRKKIFIPSLAVTEENTNKDNKKQEIKFGPEPAGHQMKSMGNGINHKPAGATPQARRSLGMKRGRLCPALMHIWL